MDRKNIITNKKAFFEYEVLETYEAGIQLLGTEVKSIRDGRCNIAESYVIEDNDELFIKSLNISPYKNGNINNHDPLRKRKILLHRKEISKIVRAVKEKGITVIPIKIYLLGSLIKVEIAICRGKKLYDKRESIKEKDNKKNLQRELKSKL